VGAGVASCDCLEEELLLQGSEGRLASEGRGTQGETIRTRLPQREVCSARAPTFKQLGMLATFKHMVQQVRILFSSG